jgi:hypothetical protein
MKSYLSCLAGVLLVTSGSTVLASLEIPDGSPVGAVDTRTISLPFDVIGDVNVSLNMTGRGGAAWDGDFYIYLQHVTAEHQSMLAVLLNRGGRTSNDPNDAASLGYGYNGLNVTFDDQAVAGNIHTYQQLLGGPLTGIFQADGRNVDPGLVLASTPVTAGLGVFNGMNPNGEWTLFVADLEKGNLAQVTDWKLEISPVPEPSTMIAGALLLLPFAVTLLRFMRKGR